MGIDLKARGLTWSVVQAGQTCAITALVWTTNACYWQHVACGFWTAPHAMIVRYLSLQDKFDPMNGQKIEQRDKLSELLHRRRNLRPFVAWLTGENGFQITFGISTDRCCAQYSAADGSPPYLMAVSAHPLMKQGYVEFLAANTPTPFAARYIITFAELKEVALHFKKTGERSDAVSWQVLNPRATKEDAERPRDL